MKLNTIDHPKTYDLSDRLRIGLAQTLGHLTLLWAFTGRKSPQGNIGKWPDGAIARACDWQGDSKMFVEALTDAGFLDRDSEHRLLVHDWEDHAERWVKASLKKLGQDFIGNTDGTTETSTDNPTDANNEASPCPVLSRPVKDLPPTGGERKRDEIFDAVAEVCQTDTGQLTKSARGALNNAVKQLRDVGATPEQVKLRAQMYRAKFPDCVLSPSALAKWWPTISPAAEDRWKRAIRLAKEKSLPAYREIDTPHRMESPEAFMARVGA